MKRSPCLWRSSAAVLASLALAAPAGAHTRNDSLGAAEAATDHLQVTCFDSGTGAPQSLSVEIRDAAPGALPQLSVTIQRGEALASASDTTDADALPSPKIALNEGGGAYRVLVTKTGAGAKSYSFVFHCTTGPDGSGSHAGTSLSVLQDQ